MRKVSRAEEQSTDVNLKTANLGIPERPATPNITNLMQPNLDAKDPGGHVRNIRPVEYCQYCGKSDCKGGCPSEARIKDEDNHWGPYATHVGSLGCLSCGRGKDKCKRTDSQECKEYVKNKLRGEAAESTFGTNPAIGDYNTTASKKLSWNERYANRFIEERNGKWVILQNHTGKVLSHHDTKEDAEASFAAMMANKHSSVTPDNSDWREDLSDINWDW